MTNAENMGINKEKNSKNSDFMNSCCFFSIQILNPAGDFLLWL